MPDDSLAPLADEVDAMLPVPYRAAAARSSGDVWSVVAEKVEIVDIQGSRATSSTSHVVVGERS